MSANPYNSQGLHQQTYAVMVDPSTGLPVGADQTATTTASPTYVSGSDNPLSTDVHGGLRVLVDDSAGVPVDYTQPVQTYASNSYTNLAANATTVIKSGPGTLASIMINTKGASANTLTLYDNTAASGTKIATIDTTANVGSLPYNLAFATGLTAVMATGTAADITATWR